MSDEDILWAVKNGEISKHITKDNVNKPLQMGRTALHFAADYGHIELIEYLLKMGADIDILDDNKITPLLNAVWENHVDAAKLLIKKGASKNGKSPQGESYLECAESDDMKALLK